MSIYISHIYNPCQYIIHHDHPAKTVRLREIIIKDLLKPDEIWQIQMRWKAWLT